MGPQDAIINIKIPKMTSVFVLNILFSLFDF
jgi:hypothetical protein